MNKQQTLQQVREQIEACIIDKAWKDEAYRKELLNNPRVVIGQEFGVQLPAEVSVNVMEETPTSLYFVLPNRPTEVSEADLSEEQLEAVAGGGPWSAVAGGIVGAGGTLLTGGSASEAIGNGLSGAALGLALPTP